jgi:thiol-disulfide isomerase/thioredoxin
MTPPVESTRVLIACLCAGWCNACRDYREVFAALAGRFADRADFAWIDVEDDADALGDLDIENFPTLLIADETAMRFLGPVTPQAQTAERLVRGALDRALGPIDDDDLLARVRALAPLRPAIGGAA